MSEGLKRRIGPILLTAYGVGVMVGAGIYVLTGVVAGASGVWAPLSFLLAGLVAAPTALSYAEFSTRYPEAAGEAAYVSRGLGRPPLAVLVGLAIVLAGTISAGAVLRGGTGYLTSVLPLDPVLSMIVLGALLIGVAVLGAVESLAVAAVFTVVELGGLALVVWAGLTAEAAVQPANSTPLAWGGIGLGAVLAFFAFIGFEDIVNMAEETRDPERTLPRAILAALAITTAIYALTAFAAVRAVPVEVLAGSEQPLALVWSIATERNPAILSAIAVFAALNGVLAQIVMASRVLYGLGKRDPRFAALHVAHPRFRTPVRATLLVGPAVILAALALPVAALAEITSAVLLSVFCLVNLALIAQKRRGPARAAFTVPMSVPVAGLALSALALALTIGAQIG